jgi:hypothetical protein
LQEEPVEEAVQIWIPLPWVGISVAEVMNRVQQLEQHLVPIVEESRLGSFDGDEFCEASCTLYFYGPSAAKLGLLVLANISNSDVPSGSVMILRHGAPGSNEERLPIGGAGRALRPS